MAACKMLISKVLLLTYKALNGQTLSYLKMVIVCYPHPNPLDLHAPRMQNYSQESPKVAVCNPGGRGGNTLCTFKNRLKMFLFDEA